MHEGRELGDMSGVELLDHADVFARTQRRCEAEILLMATLAARLGLSS